MGASISSLVFQPPARSAAHRGARTELHSVSVPSIGVRIPVLYVQPARATARRTTLLFAHGNAEDLTLIETFVRYAAETLGVGVAAYEYPGYGDSTWLDDQVSDPLLPSETRCYAAAEAAFDWLVDEQQVPSADVILFGRSLGSGPSVHLAVRCATRNQVCGGLILQSPIASVVRVVVPRICVTLPLVDMFANIDKIGAIHCRATVIHGTRDRVVPIACAHQLDAALPDHSRMPPLYIEGAGHNDVELHRNEWCAHVNVFISVAMVAAELV